MSLNPFAREFVPGVSSRVSALSIKGSGAQPSAAEVTAPAPPKQFANPNLSAINTTKLSRPPVHPDGPQPRTRAAPPQNPGAEGELEFDDLFTSASPGDNISSAGSSLIQHQLDQEVVEHQGLHNLAPPNDHLGSPCLAGLSNEKEIMDLSGSYINTPEDIEDIRDAISVPEADIQTEASTVDVLPRQAGIIDAEADPEDVEEEAISGSLARQGSVFPAGLQQVGDDAASISRKLSPQDFELHTVLGQGAFGKVFLVTKRDSGEVFAMKVMRKDRILEKDHGEYIKAEREVLTAVVHPYIVTLQYSFQTSSKLYLLMDFVNGGHLFFQLFREGIFAEDLARLYTAEIVLAISHLHRCGFVHRDLKPENILLDSDGHVKITDFGLAKKNIDDDTKTNSFIGTMEYMAPEVISGCGHGKSVDWWSVGILLFEMLTGVPPFRAKSPQALKKQITSGKIKFPTYLSSASLSILKGLLNRDVKKRLGYGSHGSEDVMKHQFFKGINWSKLLNREIPSPFRPMVKSNRSVENFDKIWTELPPEDSPCATPDHPMLLEAFKDFSYVGPSELLKSAEQIARPFSNQN